MTPDATAPDNTTLSIERAVGLLGAEREKEDQPDASGAEDASVATSAEDANGAETSENGDASPDSDTPAENDKTADTEDEGAPRLDPPRWWNKDAKARFAALSPELQAVVFAQEENRERVVQKAKQDAAEARKLADAHTAEMSQRLALLDRLAPDAAQLFAGRWANVDWSRLPDQVGAEEAFKLKAQYEKERDTLGALHAMQQAASEENFRTFVATESEKLKSVAPDLTDETHGPTRKQELGRFLLAQGFPADRIQHMSADEAAIAYDAMRWRQAQSRAQALAQRQTRQQPAQPAKPPVKPTAAAARASQTRGADDAARRLKATGRIDDAIALLNARG
jgi:hypothetical protein